MAMGWGFGEGESISVFDHLTGKNTIHKLIHGQSYEDKYKGIGDQLSGMHGSAKASLYKALAAIQSSYGGAQNALNMQGGVATKQLLDREQRSLASSQQSMVSRGLYDSTAFDASQRGIAADTNSGLAELNAQLAQIGSNLKISEGQDIAGAYGNLANLDQNYQQLLLQLGLNTEYGEQGGMGGLASGILGSISDRRLKKNIVPVGIANGVPVYEFDYVDSEARPGRYRGVMADEVEHIPGAVLTNKRGFKFVNYTKLGFEMRKVG